MTVEMFASQAALSGFLHRYINR